MASPQPDRFVRVSTELWEAFMIARLSGIQFQIVIWTMRHTFGWNRTRTKFTWYRIANDLGQDRGNVFRAGQKLIRANILDLAGGEIGIQKDYDRWQSLISKPLSGDIEKRCRGTSGALSGDIEKRCHGTTGALSVDNGGRCQETTGALSGDIGSVVVGQRNRCRETSVFREPIDSSIDIDKDISIDNPKDAQEDLPADTPTPAPETSSQTAPLPGGLVGKGCTNLPDTEKKEERDPIIEVMDFYLSFRSQSLKNGQREAFYKQFRGVAKSLLGACAGDVESAKGAIRKIGDTLVDRKLAWCLTTVLRWFSDPSLMQGGDHRRGFHPAGEAKPIPGKYAHISEG